MDSKSEASLDMSDVQEMACQELVEVITDYLEGALDAEDRRRFEEHLDGCPGCRNYLEQMRATIRLTGALKSDPIPADLREQFLGVLRNVKRRQPR
jgi:anti-sigma factor (TIGR02949 family)